MLIEYVPFGDLLGYLRKSRGLNDTYYKDPDIKPKTSLTSQQLMKFAWQIADGMSYLSSKRVRNVYILLDVLVCLIICILTRPSGSPKYCTTRKNIQRYYTLKCLIRDLLSNVNSDLPEY